VDLFSDLPNPLLSRPFAVIDFETTGLYPAMGDEICEWGSSVEGGPDPEYNQWWSRRPWTAAPGERNPRILGQPR
jgi:hypothetical protein